MLSVHVLISTEVTPDSSTHKQAKVQNSRVYDQNSESQALKQIFRIDYPGL